MRGCGNGATAEPLRHRQTKGAANGHAQPKATAPHSYSTRNCRSRRTLQIAVFNRNQVLLSPVGPDTPRRLGWMIGAARDCSRARKRVARRKRSLDRLVECAFSLRTPFTPRPLRCLPHAKSRPCLRLAAQLAKRRWVRVREEASRSEAVKAAAFAKVGDDRFLRAAHGWYRRKPDIAPSRNLSDVRPPVPAPDIADREGSGRNLRRNWSATAPDLH